MSVADNSCACFKVVLSKYYLDQVLWPFNMFINMIVFMDFPMLRTEGVFEMDDCDVQEHEATQ
jgi:hypothetical protein